MSYERPDPERGPYTPRNDDDLPFDRSGFDARGQGGGRGPLPLTLIISVGVLVALIVAVILIYRAGVRAPGEAPPVIEGGQGVAAAAPDSAQPPAGPQIEIVDPGEGDVALAPPPEAPGQRPPPLTSDTATTPPTQPAQPTQPRVEAPAAQRPTPPTTPPARPQTPAGGRAAVQIGAFSTEAAAERAYADVAAAFPQFASGRTRGIQQVTTSDGRTVYRTTVNGLSAEDARAFCGALRASGRECLVQ